MKFEKEPIRSEEKEPRKEISKKEELIDAEKEKKDNTTEDKIGKVDEIFDELLEKVKDAPEAQQEALKILIQQMRQIGEQMKQVRDMKNLQEMKTLMMKNWKELEELAGGDPELLKTIQSWGRKFVESKVIYYEFIGDIKDELIDKSQEVQENWDDMMINIGKICGLVSNLAIIESMLNIGRLEKGSLFNFRTGLDEFIKNITNPEGHYLDGNLDLNEVNLFIERLGNVLMEFAKAVEWAKRWGKNDDAQMQRAIEAEAALKELVEKKKSFSKNIKDTSKIFKMIKKVRDTHFLPLYNEQPDQIAA